MTAIEYLQRLDCKYEGPIALLQPSPDTLSELAGAFTWEKANAKRAAASSQGIDHGARHTVNEQGKSVPPLDAQDHFGPKRKGKKFGGMRDSRPQNAFVPPSAAPCSSSSKAAGAAPSSSASSQPSSSASSSSSSSTSADNEGRKVIDTPGFKGKFVLFRRTKHSDALSASGFPLLCGKVVEENSDFDNPRSYRQRCTGEQDAPKEGWRFLLKRYELVPKRGTKKGSEVVLKREDYGCPPAVRDVEQKKNTSTWHMSDKQQQNIVEKAGVRFRGSKSNFSQCYVDFNNPEHGFTVVDLNCVFTAQKILDRYTMARIRRDKLINKDLDNLLELWADEDKESGGRKKMRGGKKASEKVKSDDAAAAASSCSAWLIRS